MNSDLDNITEMLAFITKNFSANLSSAAFLPEWKKLSALYLKFADLMLDNLEL